VHFRILLPVLNSDVLAEKAAAEYRAAANGGAEISLACLPNGTRTIESDFDIALAQPETVRAAIQAENEGVDACIVACFSDPGVDAAREMVNIPVIGEGQAALHITGLLASRFSIITTWWQCLPRIRRLVLRAGLVDRLASIRATGVGVMALSNDCLGRIIDEAVQAIRKEGAAAIVLGCTGTGEDMAHQIAIGVQQAIGTPVPIIDPVNAAMSMARCCVELGLTHSKAAYPQPHSLRSEYRFANI
jgi:allantoin racemase